MNFFEILIIVPTVPLYSLYLFSKRRVSPICIDRSDSVTKSLVISWTLSFSPEISVIIYEVRLLILV